VGERRLRTKGNREGMGKRTKGNFRVHGKKKS
jgi:hypothetical protein